jgi:TRAP-type C4-dicarboxylate transport system substrate-binding protein
MMEAVRSASLVLLLLLARPASADPVVLRLAAIAPEGTAWAREVRAFSRDVETATDGAVRIKWYLGGIAGDEVASIERTRRGQLDGGAISVTCTKLAPSLKVSRVIGFFRNRDEARHVYTRLLPTLEQEALASGFQLLTVSAFGNEILFSRTPVHDMGELRKLKPFAWGLDDVWRSEWPQMGVPAVMLDVLEGTHAYETGRVDSYFALPTAAIAYQWSSLMRFYTPLPIAYMPACLLVANRAFDSLTNDQKQALRGAAAKLGARFDSVNEALEEQLVGGLFERQGLKVVRASETFLSEFFAQAQNARDHLDEKLLPRALIDKVTAWLADYRAEHR